MGCTGSVEALTTGQEGAHRNFSSLAADEAADAVAQVTGECNFTSKVRLRVGCQNLVDTDLFSKSDPFAVIFEWATPKKDAYTYSNTGGAWREVGRTEVVGNCLDPNFVRDIMMLYNFEKPQKMRIEVYDADTPGDATTLDLSTQDFLGNAEFMLADLMTSDLPVFTLPLLTRDGRQVRHNRKQSSVTVRAEEVADVRSAVQMCVSATHLRKAGSPFFVISQGTESPLARGGLSWVPVFKSEVLRSAHQQLGTSLAQPQWKPLELSMLQLCNADTRRPLRFEVFQYVKSGAHEFLGEFETCMAVLQQAWANGERAFALGGTRHASRGRTIHGQGRLVFDRLHVEQRPSFLQYIRGGTEIGFVVAVDFTASNGHPSDPNSLHYSGQGYPLCNGRMTRPTPYENAIRGVGQVLEFYDTDKLFPAYGFGATAGRGSPASHCFPLNAKPATHCMSGPIPDASTSADDAQCQGIDGVVSAYHGALTRWELSGPTLFAPVIEATAAQAAQMSPGEGYLCLLILTDGCIMDFRQTKKAIIRASRLPMCILIVGVGDHTDFSRMHELDSDDRLLSCDGEVAEQDIVQFVRFADFKNNGHALAAECLAELPGQLLRHMHRRGVEPGKRYKKAKPSQKSHGKAQYPAAQYPARLDGVSIGSGIASSKMAVGVPVTGTPMC